MSLDPRLLSRAKVPPAIMPIPKRDQRRACERAVQAASSTAVMLRSQFPRIHGSTPAFVTALTQCSSRSVTAPQDGDPKATREAREVPIGDETYEHRRENPRSSR